MANTKGAVVQPDHGEQVMPLASEPISGRAECIGRAGRIGRAEILGKYWELANLDPEVTKGTITGQLKALDSLCEELALEESDDGEVTGQQKQQIYRSAWLREAAGKERRAVAAPPASGFKRASVTRDRAKADKSAGRAAEA